MKFYIRESVEPVEIVLANIEIDSEWEINNFKDRSLTLTKQSLWHEAFSLYYEYNGLYSPETEWEFDYNNHTLIDASFIYQHLGVRSLCIAHTTYEKMFATEDGKTITYYDHAKTYRWIDKTFWQDRKMGTTHYWDFTHPELEPYAKPIDGDRTLPSNWIKLHQKPQKSQNVQTGSAPKPTIITSGRNHNTTTPTYTGLRTITTDKDYIKTVNINITSYEQALQMTLTPKASCLEQQTIYYTDIENRVWLAGYYDDNLNLVRLTEPNLHKALQQSSQNIYVPIDLLVNEEIISGSSYETEVVKHAIRPNLLA